MVVVVAMLVAGCGHDEVRDDPTAETMTDEAKIAAGMKLFVRNGCATCHGENGKGDGAIAHTLNPRPRDFRDVSTYKQGYSLEQIAGTIANGVAGGRSSMPAYPHISAGHQRLIARYITSLQAQLEGGSIVVTAPWIRETLPPHRTGAGYMTIFNHAGQEDVLTGAEAETAGAIEIHLMSHGEEKVAMRRVGQIGIPGHGQVELQPGGLHLMLIDLENRLREGDEVPITLHFKNAGSRTVAVPVHKKLP